MSADAEGAWSGQGPMRELAEKLAEISTHPEFLRMLKEIKEAPPEERVGRAVQLSTVDNLRERGVPVSPEFRLTTRYFENPDALLRGDVLTSTTEVRRPPEEVPVEPVPVSSVTVCFSVGAVVCASVGTSTDIPRLPE